MKLTALVSPSPDTLGPTEVTSRAFHHVDDFCAALSAAAGVPVAIVEGTLADIPGDGFVLVYRFIDLEHDLTPELAPRIVVVDAPLNALHRLLWTADIAAGIDNQRYSDWCDHRDEETGRGLFARKDIAERWGATEIEPGYSTKHYAEHAHPNCRDLPQLLATYLAALARDAPPS